MSTSNAAEIGAIADSIDMYRSRVAGLAEPLTGPAEEEIRSALYEAERLLRGTHRAMRRAFDLARGAPPK